VASISIGKREKVQKMRLKDTLKLSLNELRHSKLRTWLTIIGIIIGIAAVVSIVSIGQGLQATVSSNLGGLGADIITVQSGFNRASGGFNFRVGGDHNMGTMGTSPSSDNLTIKDLTAIKSVPNIKYLSGIISGRKEISFSGETSTVSIRGVDPSVWKLITNSQLESGRYLSPGDSNTIVIGSRIANTMFKKPITINSQIALEGRSFKVVGILAESGSFGGEDSTIFMPIKTAASILDINPDQFSSIQLKVADKTTVEETVNNIENRLMLSRHVRADTKDFTVISALSIQQTVGQITSSITLFLGGIAGISLLVGAIGISNTMYMSVTERRKRIGILKALGSTNGEVLRLFLIESATLGLIGGVIGVVLGSVASVMISGISMGGGMGPPGSRGGITTMVSPELIIFSILFSLVIGVLSGIFPARQAARLQPVDTLRSE